MLGGARGLQHFRIKQSAAFQHHGRLLPHLHDHRRKGLNNSGSKGLPVEQGPLNVRLNGLFPVNIKVFVPKSASTAGDAQGYGREGETEENEWLQGL
ncbi:hypothetical protein MHYP_G00234080 [Metynnis hypsauchen]